MALSGTLKDFGIADILQLIGQQTKTGSLLLANQGREIEVSFVEGNVVFASEKARSAHEFLGSMLVRAQVISQEQLDRALQQQKRSLKRLGDVLVELGFVTAEALAQMARLQTTETLYKLFRWRNGTYEFTQREIEADRAGFAPIRAETILLEGFRRMDEWPSIRKKIPWDEATCERAQELDTSGAEEGPAADADDDEDGKPQPRHKRLYRLAEPGRTVRQIADLSRLGEFEALKGLQQLADWGFLRVVPPPRGAAAAVKGLAASGRWLGASGTALRVAVAAAVFAATLLVARSIAPAFGSQHPQARSRSGAVARLLAKDQVLRLESALELYRLEHGEYPQGLPSLVEARIVSEEDLRYPYPEPYYYRRTGQGAQQGFVLLPPLH